ncbi:MAG TPA: cupin domain-containing protein [Solirubrobacteraceae bacterium]|jgi:mannose-6-phosphate isomerase-like protein (cupin superfamily)
MADYTLKRIDDMQAAYGGALKKARAELGVSSFGMQIVDLPPNFSDYPEHDHAEESQEEVFAVLRGSGHIDVDGEHVDIGPDTVVRVGAAARRKIYSGPEGLRLVALGGTPGAPYEIKSFSELTND